MKKYVLYISTILAAGVMNDAWADAPSCVAESSFASSSRCNDLGYIYNLSACSGKNMIMKCPFDTSKVWCLISKEKTCAVGDILFSNKKCYYDTSALPVANPSLEPIAVVFDATNKLAIELVASSQGVYLNTSTGYTGIVYSDDNGRHGRATTTAMSGYCGYSGFSVKLGQLSTAPVPLIQGCKPNNVDVVPDRDDNNTPESTFRALKTTISNQKGWLATQGLVNVHGQKAYDGTATLIAGPAKYCYDKNAFSCCVKGTCSGTQAGTCPDTNATLPVQPWFLPSIGDLFTLKDNLASVNSGLTKASSFGWASAISDDSLFSTTIASSPASKPALYLGSFPSGVTDYIHSWLVRRFNQNWGVATSTGYYVHDHSYDNQGSFQTRCIIYYGTGWTVPNHYYVAQGVSN